MVTTPRNVILKHSCEKHEGLWDLTGLVTSGD